MLQTQLDGAWAIQDWPAAIQALTALRNLAPDNADYKDKLYAAYINDADRLYAVYLNDPNKLTSDGDRNQMAAQLSKAAELDGGRDEAKDRLLARPLPLAPAPATLAPPATLPPPVAKPAATLAAPQVPAPAPTKLPAPFLSSNFLVKMLGTIGTRFTLQCMAIQVDGSSASQSFEGLVPAEYPSDARILSCVGQNKAANGQLIMQITKDGQVLKTSDTTAAYGVVQAATQ